MERGEECRGPGLGAYVLLSHQEVSGGSWYKWEYRRQTWEGRECKVMQRDMRLRAASEPQETDGTH